MEPPGTESELIVDSIGRPVRLLHLPPPAEPRGTVLLLHGLGDHVERYGWAYRLLRSAGYAVLALEWPGCGNSPGIRGDLPTVSQAGDLLEEAVRVHAPDLAGIVAHSTGGFLLIPALTRPESPLRRAQWFWFSSPLLRPTHRQSRLKVAAAKAAGRLWPRLTLSTGVRDAKCVVEPDADDRLDEAVHHRISLRFGRDILDWDGRIWDRVADLPPHGAYLLTQGSEDEVCPPPFALRLFDALPATDRTLIYARASRHEPFRERHRAGLINGIRGWLHRRSETTH